MSLFTLYHAVQAGFNDCLRAAVIHVPHTAVKTLPATSSDVHEIANMGFQGGWGGVAVAVGVLCKEKSRERGLKKLT